MDNLSRCGFNAYLIDKLSMWGSLHTATLQAGLEFFAANYEGQCHRHCLTETGGVGSARFSATSQRGARQHACSRLRLPP